MPLTPNPTLLDIYIKRGMKFRIRLVVEDAAGSGTAVGSTVCFPAEGGMDYEAIAKSFAVIERFMESLPSGLWHAASGDPKGWRVVRTVDNRLEELRDARGYVLHFHSREAAQAVADAQNCR